MAKQYRIRPSELLNIEDEYTAFCFDEACAFISNNLESGKEPGFDELEIKEEIKKVYSGHYSSPSEMYKALDSLTEKQAVRKRNSGKTYAGMTGGKIKWE